MEEGVLLVACSLRYNAVHAPAYIACEAPMQHEGELFQRVLRKAMTLT